MSRKPVHLVRPGGKATGRQGIWEAIRKSPQSFSIRTLRDATDIHEDTIRTYIKALVAAGIVRRIAAARGRDHYGLLVDTGVDAPRLTRDGKPVTQGAAREQMWRAMRMLKDSFGARDLAVMASIEGQRIALVDAQDYCRDLAKAGYLGVAHNGGANQAARYRFVPTMNTGPRPPMVCRTRIVWDPNLRKIVWPAEIDS